MLVCPPFWIRFDTCVDSHGIQQTGVCNNLRAFLVVEELAVDSHRLFWKWETKQEAEWNVSFITEITISYKEKTLLSYRKKTP